MTVNLVLNDSGTGIACGSCSVDFAATAIRSINGDTITANARVTADRDINDFALHLVSARTGLVFAESETASIPANTETDVELTIRVNHSENAFSIYSTADSASTILRAVGTSAHSMRDAMTDVTVLRYKLSLMIDFGGLIRCSSDGTPADEGENVRIGRLRLISNYDWNVTASDLTVRTLTIKQKYGSLHVITIPDSVLTAALSADGYSEDEPALLSNFTFGAHSGAYFISVIIGDDATSATASVELPEAFANLHLSGCSTGGVAMGGFSTARENAPKFECWYPAYFYGGSALSGIRAREEVRQNVNTSNDTDYTALTHTVSEAGTYIIVAQARFSSNATGRRMAQLNLQDADGSNEVMIGTQSQPANSGKVSYVQVIAISQIRAGQKVTLVVNQNSGGTLALQGNAAGTYTHMTFCRMI